MAQRKARSADRDKTVEVINSAYVDGQLNGSERDSRVTRALKARTLVQLDRLTLDLQHPEPRPRPPAPRPTLREQFRQTSIQQRKEWSRVPRWQKALLGGAMALCIGGLGVAVVVGNTGNQTASAVEGQGSFALTASGMESFVEAYEAKFETTSVVSAIFATDGVTLKVPTPDGKSRHEGWHYRDGNFKQTEDARVNPHGHSPMDLADIDLPRLEDNIAEAKRTLSVEKPDELLIWVEREYAKLEPSVRIQIGNEFQEVGMLTTDLTGERVIHRSPFTAP